MYASYLLNISMPVYICRRICMFVCDWGTPHVAQQNERNETKQTRKNMIEIEAIVRTWFIAFDRLYFNYCGIWRMIPAHSYFPFSFIPCSYSLAGCIAVA